MIKFSPAFFKRLRGIKGGGAPVCAAPRAALCAMRSRKRPCQPKTAKRIFGGPVHKAPSGQAKERMRVLPARRDLLRLACRAVCRGGRSCTACRCYVGFRAWCPGGFFRRCAAALSPACGLSDASALGLVCAAAACLPCACARVFSSVFCLFPPNFFLSKIFSLVAHAATGTPFSFRKENGGKEPRGGAIAPPSNPHSCALRPIFSSFALLAGLTALRAANRRLTGKRLKSQGAELSFSSVSVRRGTPVPFRQSPPFSRCWPACAAIRPQTAGW